MPASDSLITPRFMVVLAAAFGYYVSIAMLMPTLPRFIVNDLGGGELQVGLVMGAFGVAAAAGRPFVGRLGDRYGRRPLLMVGAAVSGFAIFLYPLFLSIPLLILVRGLNGLGETGAFVGSATAAQDFAPPHRRAEVASLFSTAIYVAMGLGPVAGEFLYRRGGLALVCQVGAASSLLAVFLGSLLPAGLGKTVMSDTARRRRGLLHPAAIAPGILMAFSLLGFMAFSSFIALYLDAMTGDGNTGPLFLLYSAVVLTVRISLAGLADRWGPRRTGSAATLLGAMGLAVLAGVESLVGVYVGTTIMAVGIALGYPAFFLLVMADTTDDERSHAVASFAFFFDLPGALAAPLLGLIIGAAGSVRAGFAVGAVSALVAFAGLRRLTAVPPVPARDDIIDAFNSP